VSNALQNRLVGTVILVAVTVIFLPDYLDGKKQTNTETFVDFPRSNSNLSAIAPDPFPAEEVAKATRREIVVIDEQAADALLQQTQITQETSDKSDEINSQNNATKEVVVNSADAEPAAQENSLAKQTIAKSAPDNANDNAGWVVQLGSFGNQKNVNDLLRKLEKAGYRSFSRKVQTSAGRLTKVFVGPELDKQKLELALPHLKETTGLTGKVTTFDVVSN